ncbi:MAG: alpha-L-arabinofuranosidase, partial [Pedobacter sp.]
DVVSITLDDQNIIGQDGLFASSVIDKTKKELIIKIANNTKESQSIIFDLEGKTKLKTKGTIEELASEHLSQLNSFENPLAVSPKAAAISIKDKKLSTSLRPYSFNVIKIPFISYAKP